MADSQSDAAEDPSSIAMVEHCREIIEANRPRCDVCGSVKKNLASYKCMSDGNGGPGCGQLCRGCDAKKHPGSEPPVSKPLSLEPASYLLIHNVSKKANGWQVIRSCVALGVRMVVVAGSDKMNSFGCQGAERYMTFKHFPKLSEATSWLKNDCGCDIVGVEICDEAKPLASAPFKGPTAFLLGNEGHGLTQDEMKLCDWFVYIPQHGRGTASLNVAVAASIVLYGFATWAKYAEAPREGYKYTLAPRPDRTSKRNRVAGPQ